METFLGKYKEEFLENILEKSQKELLLVYLEEFPYDSLNVIMKKSLEKLLPHFPDDEVLIYIPAGIFNGILSIIPEPISGGLLDEILVWISEGTSKTFPVETTGRLYERIFENISEGIFIQNFERIPTEFSEGFSKQIAWRISEEIPGGVSKELMKVYLK